MVIKNIGLISKPKNPDPATLANLGIGSKATYCTVCILNGTVPVSEPTVNVNRSEYHGVEGKACMTG